MLFVVLAALLIGFTPNSLSAQRICGPTGDCYTIPPRTGRTTPSPGRGSEGNSEESGGLNAEQKRRYKQLYEEVDRLWKITNSLPTSLQRKTGYERVLTLLEQQQKIIDGPNVRESMARIAAVILWNKGAISAGNEDYQAAILSLLGAYKSRPEMFSQGNLDYIIHIEKLCIAS
jgi:hypothetical protein